MVNILYGTEHGDYRDENSRLKRNFFFQVAAQGCCRKCGEGKQSASAWCWSCVRANR